MTRRLFVVRVVVGCGWLTAFGPQVAQARQQATAQPGPDLAALEQGVQTAPVLVDGEMVLRVRGVSAFPAEQRARAIAERIREIGADAAIRPEALRVEETDVSSRIVAGRQLVMNVYDVDAAVEGMARPVLASLYLSRVRSTIASYRLARGAPALQRAVGEAAVATAVFLALVAAIIWLRRRLDAILDSRYGQKIESLDAMSHDVVSVKRLWKFLDATLRFARTLVIAILALVYLRYVLALFPYTRPAARSVTGYVVGPLETMWSAFISKIPDLIFLAILVIVVRIVLRMVRRFFEAVEQGRIHLANFDREWATPTYKLLRPGIIAFAIVVGYPYIPGSESDAFKGVSLFLGIVFSLGSSSFIANMIAGYSMTYRRAFRLGDFVQIGEVRGVVSAVRLQVTHVRTIKNEEVIVPNSQILNASVVNYSSLAQSKGLILHTTVGIGYETPWRQVEAMLLEAARRTPGLLPDPPPFVLHLQLGDFCVTYELNVYCAEPLRMRAVYTDLHRQILDVFNEYGVQIMTPAYEGDPEVPKVVPKDQWYLAPARPDAAPGGARPQP